MYPNLIGTDRSYEEQFKAEQFRKEHPMTMFGICTLTGWDYMKKQYNPQFGERINENNKTIK